MSFRLSLSSPWSLCLCDRIDGFSCSESFHDVAVSSSMPGTAMLRTLASEKSPFRSAERCSLLNNSRSFSRYTKLVIGTYAAIVPWPCTPTSCGNRHFLARLCKKAQLCHAWNLTTRCLAVTGGGSVGECDRLSQPSAAFGRTNIVILTCLFVLVWKRITRWKEW